jgi:hypothetical protein
VTETERAEDRTPTRQGSDRPARVIAALVLTLAVVIGASTGVGFVGSHDEDFSWELASIFGTALGTTLLAVATGWLAWSTRSEVRATQDLAELTKEQQAASDRPVVLLRLVSWSGSPESGTLTVDLQNVGLGPALRVRWTATYVGDPDRPERQPGLQPTPVAAIEPGSVERVEVPANFPAPHQPGGVRSDAFEVVGTYLDRSMLNPYKIITDWRENADGAT